MFQTFQQYDFFQTKKVVDVPSLLTGTNFSSKDFISNPKRFMQKY